MAERSSAERYGLVILANAAFFAVVVGGLWILFQLNAASEGGPGLDSGRIEVRATRTEPVDLTPAAPEPASEEIRDTERLRLADVAPQAVDEPLEEVRAADLSRDVTSGGGPVDLRAERPAAAESGPPLIDAGGGGAELSAEEAAEAQWAKAGGLASELEATYPCSSFALRASSGADPVLEGEVADPAHAVAARARIAEVLGEGSTVTVGLGCTAAIGGGYVAVSDAGGAAKVIAGENLTIPVLSALPRDATCSTIGGVVDAQPRLVDQIATGGEPRFWVTRGGVAGVCYRDGGAWRVDMAAGGPAAAILAGGDVLAAEARREAGVATPAPSAPQTVADAPEPRIPDTRPAPAIETTVSLDDGVGGPLSTEADSDEAEAAEPTEESDEVVDPFGDDPIPVKPVLAEQPVLPEGVGPFETMPTVSTSFTVHDDGRAQDIVVVGADTLDGVVIAEAVRAISASRFPPPEPDQNGAYRGSYAVTFVQASESVTPAARPEPARSAATTADTTAQGNTSGGEPVWWRTLSEADFASVFPNRAKAAGRSGVVILGCSIRDTGRLTCSVQQENPRGWGFREAAIELSRRLRAESRLSNGDMSANAQIELEFEFIP